MAVTAAVCRRRRVVQVKAANKQASNASVRPTHLLLLPFDTQLDNPLTSLSLAK